MLTNIKYINFYIILTEFEKYSSYYVMLNLAMDYLKCV